MDNAKPNVLFIGIDSFRSDKFFGSNKSSKTPNIDNLIKNGAYFDQHISVSDGSYTCMGAVFTSQYPFQSGLSTVSEYSKSTEIFKKFKEAGYTLLGTAPCTPFFINLLENFDEKENFFKPGFLHQSEEQSKKMYPYSEHSSEEYEKKGKTGPLILNRLDRIAKNEIKSPWFYFIFLTDLHRSVNYNLPDEFNSEIYGETDYDRMVSMLDVWIGKFLKRINLENTIVVITSDHGDFIPTKKVGHEMTYIPYIFEPGSKLKSKLPKIFHPLFGETYRIIRRIIIPIRNKRLQKKLSSLEFRSLHARGSNQLKILPDDTFRVPFLLSGWKIKPKTNVISQQIRSVDIIPTIAELLSIPFDDSKVEGRSVLPLIHGMEMPESIAFIENAVRRNPTRPGHSIGLRTSKWKYYRSLNEPKKDISLYDLKNDPNEINNIQESYPDVVKNFEKILCDKRKNAITLDDVDPEEKSKIENLLKPFGPSA